jgi:hypothetical protein
MRHWHLNAGYLGTVSWPSGSLQKRDRLIFIIDVPFLNVAANSERIAASIDADEAKVLDPANIGQFAFQVIRASHSERISFSPLTQDYYVYRLVAPVNRSSVTINRIMPYEGGNTGIKG